MPHDPAKLLWDMREAALRIERFAAGKSYQDYLNDELLRSGIERQFEIIGEAMTRLVKADPTTAAKITDYRKIAGFRNALIHGYDHIDHEIAWGVVINKLPLLREELQKLLPPSET
jgi:uncharacterized protein with HEPN domain